MKIKIMIVSVLFAMVAVTSSSASNGLATEQKSNCAKIESVTNGYRFPFEFPNQIDVLPSLEVAFQVALPILQDRFHQSFARNMPFKGYLANDSIWVIYGGNPVNEKGKPCEGGFPYIELNKHDGKVVKILHTK